MSISHALMLSLSKHEGARPHALAGPVDMP